MNNIIHHGNLNAKLQSNINEYPIYNQNDINQANKNQINIKNVIDYNTSSSKLLLSADENICPIKLSLKNKT